MFDGANGCRRQKSDPNGLLPPLRDRSSTESTFLGLLWQRECEMRDLIGSIPTASVEARAKMTALTKLDELVMWATRAIDG